uniref:DUF547 domain-containing protein n=1 Tax=Kalanchoe fedtschenkoi TaxID=63787 RepID=A0A7N0ZWX5_KALFE
MSDLTMLPPAACLLDPISNLTHSGVPRCGSATAAHSASDFQSEHSYSELRIFAEEAGYSGSCPSNGAYSSPSKFQLEKDVQRLHEQLQEEMELHKVLESALERIYVKSPRPSPIRPQELVANLATLEATVSALEQELLSLHFRLSQERNERRLAEYRTTHLSLQKSKLSRCVKQSTHENSQSTEETSYHEGRNAEVKATEEVSPATSSLKISGRSRTHSRKTSVDSDTERRQSPVHAKLTKEMPTKGLWEYPNRLSEEMIRCMKNIFISLADSAAPFKSSTSISHFSPTSPHGHLSSSSFWSLSERTAASPRMQSPQVDVNDSDILAADNAYDPYRVHGKLSWKDIGNYGSATEVSWMCVGKKQLEYAAAALRKFRILVEQLAKVNPTHLNGNEKLAFWINLYNALLMHAYLAYGVPKSELKLFSLMQKAAYTVGGHSFSAAAIEYVILRMKPPVHRPQIALLLALHKLKMSDEQRKFAIDAYEPLLTFALSSGMYSSPAVRIYHANNVKEELEEAQRDFVRAAVGVSSKGKLLVPKLLHCFAKGFVDDQHLAVWISSYLQPDQALFVEQSMSLRRQKFLGSRNCGILPFDSRFRYLLLPETSPL